MDALRASYARAVAAAALLLPCACRPLGRAAARVPGPPASPLPPERTEWAVIPSLGSTPDLGYIFGVGGIVSRFGEGREPYRSKHTFYLNGSMKEAPDGWEYPYACYGIESDLPGLLGGRLRLYPAAWYMRTINAGYFGLGNASSDELPSPAPPVAEGRYFQYIGEESVAELCGRVELGRTDLMLGAKLRHASPSVYSGSKLDEDVNDPSTDLYGVGGHSVFQAALGAVRDTRDSETAPSSGGRQALSVRLGQGVEADDEIRFGGVNVSLRSYTALGDGRSPRPGGNVLAARARADFLFGNVPFYELARGSAFGYMEMPGGPSGVRGVPAGRFSGKIKLVSSLELRSGLVEWSSPKRRSSLGAVVFADAGRVWADYERDPALDGTGAGLAFGAGAGLHLRWGEAILIRCELAYSPDALDSGVAAPFGLYVLARTAF